MNIQEKKEMLLKLAEELTHELGHDESLFLMGYFRDFEYVERRAYCAPEFVAASLISYCRDCGLSQNDFNRLLSNMKDAYDEQMAIERRKQNER